MERSENNIEEILNSLNNIKRAEARPFMHTRVMARLQEEKSVWGHVISFVARPVVAVACMVAVIATNLYFVATTEQEQTETVTTTAINSAAEDYFRGDNFVMAVNNFENNE